MSDMGFLFGGMRRRQEVRPVRSTTTRFLANGKTLVQHHTASIGIEHRLTPEDRAQRRRDNRTMKFMRLQTRGRNVHGRNGVSARKAFGKKHS